MSTLLSHKSTDQVTASSPTLNHVLVSTTCDARFSTVPASGIAHTSTSIQQHNRSLNMNPAIFSGSTINGGTFNLNINFVSNEHSGHSVSKRTKWKLKWPWHILDLNCFVSYEYYFDFLWERFYCYCYIVYISSTSAIYYCSYSIFGLLLSRCVFICNNTKMSYPAQTYIFIRIE